MIEKGDMVYWAKEKWIAKDIGDISCLITKANIKGWYTVAIGQLKPIYRNGVKVRV